MSRQIHTAASPKRQRLHRTSSFTGCLSLPDKAKSRRFTTAKSKAVSDNKLRVAAIILIPLIVSDSP